MKKILTALYRVLCDASIIFSAIVLFFTLFVFKTDTSYLNNEILRSFFLFSLVFGLSSVLFQIRGIPRFILVFLHFVVNLVNFIFYILKAVERTSSQVFVGAALFVALYLVITLLIWLVTIPFRKSEKVIETEETL